MLCDMLVMKFDRPLKTTCKLVSKRISNQRPYQIDTWRCGLFIEEQCFKNCLNWPHLMSGCRLLNVCTMHEGKLFLNLGPAM